MKDKILIIGRNEPYNVEYFLSESFKQLGFSTRLLGIKLNKYLEIIGSLSNMRLNVNKIYNKHIIKEIKNFDPDIILIFKGTFLDENLLKVIKFLDGKKRIIIHYMNDESENNNFINHSLRLAPFVDFIFTTAYNYLPIYYQFGFKAYYLPFACFPLIHNKISDMKINKFSYDVIFVGTYRPEREILLKALLSSLAKFKKIRIGIFGRGWQKSRYTIVKNLAMSHELIGESLTKAYNSSKIVLNIHKPLDKIDGMKANMRVFEATGCGSLLLTDYIHGIEEFYNIGKELLTYNNVEDLVSSIDFLLTNENTREEIAHKGFERTHREHAYLNRVKYMMSLINF
jgi:spore maturation protein CgeB